MAEDIKFEFNPPLHGDDFEVSRGWVEAGIPSLPPGYEIRVLVDDILSYENSKFPRQYEVAVSYSGGISSRRRDARYILDLAPYFDVVFARDVILDDFLDPLKKLIAAQSTTAKTLRELSAILAKRAQDSQNDSG